MVLSPRLMLELNQPLNQHLNKVSTNNKFIPINHRRRIKNMMLRLEAEGKRNNLSKAKIQQHIEYHVLQYLTKVKQVPNKQVVEYKGRPPFYIAGDRTKLFKKKKVKWIK